MPILFDADGQLYDADFASPVSIDEVEDNIRSTEDSLSDARRTLEIAKALRSGDFKEADKDEGKSEEATAAPAAPAVPEAPAAPVVPEAPAAPATPAAPANPISDVTPAAPAAPAAPSTDDGYAVL